MRRKQVLSLLMLVTGVRLLAAAMSVGTGDLGDEEGRLGGGAQGRHAES